MLGTLGHNDAWPGGGDDEPFDFGVELEQGVAVVQGRDADVSVFVNNNADASVSGVTVELLVDADDDGFTDGDVVASQTAGFDAGEYRDSDVVRNNASDFNFSGNDPDKMTIADVQALLQLSTEQ